MRDKAWARWILITVALVVGLSVASWEPLEFEDLSGVDFASRFSVIVFFALLIERTVEILMSVWRSEEANKREAAVQRLIADKVAPTDPALVTAQQELIAYKAQTLQWAMPFGFALGLLVAGLGVRALSQFVVTPPAGGIGVTPSPQSWWFNAGDIVFTGALLAGGADPIHKILDLFRKFLESSSARAAGTKP